MDALLYWLSLSFIRLLQALPLRWVARLGRAGGGLAYWVDARHRRVALGNLTRCFGNEKSAPQIRALAKENFKRLGENYGCAVKTASMRWSDLEKHLEFGGLEELGYGKDQRAGTPGIEPSPQPFNPSTLSPRRSEAKAGQRSDTPAGIVMAIGHFGNFELYARANQLFPEFQFATTYRALRQASLNKLLVELRTGSGCLVFERRRDGDALRAAMSSQRLLLGFLSDQHAGTGGAWIPFFNQPCSTTTAPAIFALRYKVPLHTAICYRIGLARWRIEVGEEIPTQQDGQRRSSAEIMLEVNRAFEAAIRRDPANWFWVHKRWKPNPSKAQGAKANVEQPAVQLDHRG